MYTKIIELTTDKSTNIKVPLDTSYKKKKMQLAKNQLRQMNAFAAM